MDPTTLILLLALGGIALLIGELALPTHGILGVLGLICFGAAIAVVFKINRNVGLGVLIGAIVVSPLLANLGLKLWLISPVGKRLVLQPTTVSSPPPAVRVGQVGTTVTELRPMGECDFGEARIEVISQLGIVEPGTRVRVVELSNGRPTVKPLDV